MKILPEETVLVGGSLIESGVVRGDTTYNRILDLTENYLKRLGASKESGGWDTLFQDPCDGRYWERIYPESYLQGGGPPELHCLSSAEAKSKYGDLISED